jgi:hypothetical protein
VASQRWVVSDMEELLAKYQDELVRIRRLCRAFAERVQVQLHLFE